MKPESDAGNDAAAGRDARDRAEDGVVVGEPRWPMAGAVLAAMVLTILLPDGLRLGPRWLLPLIEGLLLVAVVAGDPGRITRRSRELRALSIVLVSVLVFSALWATVLLIDHLINGGAETNSASDLLQPEPCLGIEQHRVRAALLGARRRRRGGARPQPLWPTPTSRSRSN